MIENNKELYSLLDEYIELQRFFEKNVGFKLSYAEYGIESESDALKRKTENSVLLKKAEKYRSLMKEISSKLSTVEKIFQITDTIISQIDKDSLIVYSYWDSKSMKYPSISDSSNYIKIIFCFDDMDDKSILKLQKIKANQSNVNLTGYFKHTGNKVFKAENTEHILLTVIAKLIAFEDLNTNQISPKKSGFFHWF